MHKPRGEAAAGQDAEDDLRRLPVRIAGSEAILAENHRGLWRGNLDHLSTKVAEGRQPCRGGRRTGRQVGEKLAEPGCEFSRGDVASEAVIRNADGSKTMFMVRLKVLGGAITEIETIKANKGEADRLWDPDTLTRVSPALQLSIREADRDSYYDLIGTAESYWRAFQTNGTPNYHRARLLPDSLRFENGLQTTGVVRDGVFNDTSRGFDEGKFIGRNIWDRRYAVVDEERGVVLAIVRFGLKAGAKSQSVATSNDRLVAEFFAIKAGYIQEIHAVLFNLPDAKPTGWPADDGPPRAAAQ
jgi:hypothetical protein